MEQLKGCKEVAIDKLRNGTHYKYITWDLNFAQTRRNLITFEEQMGRENFFVNRNSNVCFPHDKLEPGTLFDEVDHS